MSFWDFILFVMFFNPRGSCRYLGWNFLFLILFSVLISSFLKQWACLRLWLLFLFESFCQWERYYFWFLWSFRLFIAFGLLLLFFALFILVLFLIRVEAQRLSINKRTNQLLVHLDSFPHLSQLLTIGFPAPIEDFPAIRQIIIFSKFLKIGVVKSIFNIYSFFWWECE